MRRILSATVAAVLAAFSLSASASAMTGGHEPTGTFGDPKTDIAKMYRVKHELKFDLAGTKATLDGQPVQASKAIAKDGRVFVPLRLLRDSGAAASVTWDGKKREVRVVMKPEVSPPVQELTFRLGSDRVYAAGQPFGDVKIPVPFAENGLTYIPVQTLSYLGVFATASQGTVAWNWSEKRIDVLVPSWGTDGETTTFTMLYQQDMYPPQFLSSYGAGGWSGGTGKLTDRGLSMDGRSYNRMEFTARLRPGLNPLQLYAVSGGTADFNVLRQVADPQSVPVSLTEEGKLYLSMTAPKSGYVKAKPGDKIEVAGTLLKENSNFDTVTLVLQKYEPAGGGLGHRVYEVAGTTELAIKDGKFAGSIEVKQPGHYLLAVNSPAYIPSAEHGPASTQWAEITVEAE